MSRMFCPRRMETLNGREVFCFFVFFLAKRECEAVVDVGEKCWIWRAVFLWHSRATMMMRWWSLIRVSTLECHQIYRLHIKINFILIGSSRLRCSVGACKVLKFPFRRIKINCLFMKSLFSAACSIWMSHISHKAPVRRSTPTSQPRTPFLTSVFCGWKSKFMWRQMGRRSGGGRNELTLSCYNFFSQSLERSIKVARPAGNIEIGCCIRRHSEASRFSGNFVNVGLQ